MVNLVLEKPQELMVRGFRVRAQLPLGYKLRDYVPNHHYVEIEDPNGNVHHMPAVELIEGKCRTCSQVFFVKTRQGDMTCPHCRGGVDWVWGEARLAFVPETAAHFTSHPPGVLHTNVEGDTE